ncbi:MAG: phosphoglucosamine mutase [Oligoflexia bacterium]|nr:phosphoglucosamine mutase [Oligoflexia bacterium]MBF0367362.1 phosphoglucosamine mutase [Oligoflexia bacterium]
MSKRVLFGTDGIRGKANIYPMTGEVAFTLGRAITSHFQRFRKNYRPLIVIGKDTRLSCYMLEQALSAGVCAQGGRGILTGPLPTPGVAFLVESMRADAGVMISASHNEYWDNGIKIFDGSGHKLPDEVELELEAMVLNPAGIESKVDGDLGSTKRLDEVIGRYIVHAKSAFDNKKSLEGMRLVLDCANGAAYKVAPMVFSELGAEVLVIGASPNGTNINDNTGAMFPEACAEKVMRYRADLGICLDGDADRLILVDNQGNVVNGDRVIGVCARYLRDKGDLANSKEVVGTIMSNLGLEHYLRDLGLALHRTKVGDRYIIEQMRKSGALLGGEPSGHLIFRNYSTTGDGIVSALKVIECMLYYKKSFAELASEVKLYPQILKNVTTKSRPPLDSVPRLMAAQEKAIRELGDRGRIVLRYSGTGPLVRVMVEGEESDQVHRVCSELEQVLVEELT